MGVQEGVSEDHSQFRGTEGHVTAARVQSTDALLQSQETCVDRGTLHTPLPVVTLAVGGALRARQIDQKKLALSPTLAVLDFDLADSV